MATHSSRRQIQVLAIVAIFATSAGCVGSNAIPRADVSGTVTFKSEPIVEGAITFIPKAGVIGAPVQLSIKEGRYSSSSDKIDDRGVVIGQNTVEILAYKKTGKQIKAPDNSMMDEIIQYVPARFNTSTELTQEIKAGKNQFDFDLK